MNYLKEFFKWPGIVLLGISVSLMASWSYAAPFVVTEPMTVDITECDFELDGTVTTVPAEVDESCKLDLAGIKVGDHAVKVKARNLWGESEYSPPFLFPKQLPPSPTVMGLSDK